MCRVAADEAPTLFFASRVLRRGTKYVGNCFTRHFGMGRGTKPPTGLMSPTINSWTGELSATMFTASSSVGDCKLGSHCKVLESLEGQLLLEKDSAAMILMLVVTLPPAKTPCPMEGLSRIECNPGPLPFGLSCPKKRA
jgi:hypothetical protein